MSQESSNDNNNNSFEYRLRKMNNEELISILKFRDQFQKHAVKAAIKEALNRGIINSIDDLNSAAFSPEPIPPKSLFPIGMSFAQNLGIFKSLCRIFYIFGMLPIIFGIFQLRSGATLIPILAIFSGVLIFIVVNRFEKTRKPVFVNLILAFNIPAIFIGFFYFKSLQNPARMDTVSIVIVILVILYTTLYASKLASHLNKSEANK